MTRKRPLSSFNQKQVDESRRQQVEFLDALRGNKQLGRLPMSVRAAADLVGINRRSVIRWKEKDPAFASAYEDALEDSADVLEDEAVRRAVDGVPKAVYYMGEVVGREVVYSDDLLKFVLAGRRPERYRPNHQLNVQTNVNLEGPSDRDVAKALSLLIEETKAKQLENT